MHVFTPKNQWIQSFFRELQALLFGDEFIAVGTNDKPLDVSSSEPVHHKSLEFSKSKPKPESVAPGEDGKELLKVHNKIITTENKTKQTKNKTRRGYGPKNKRNKTEKNQELSIIGTNSAGLTSKKESLFSLINTFKPSIITIQEIKHTKFEKIKIPGYQSFERIRRGKAGGGLLTSVIDDLDAVLIATADDDIELMTVEVGVGSEKIRIINGYGP